MALCPSILFFEFPGLLSIRMDKKELLRPIDPALLKAKRNIFRLIAEFKLRNSKAA